MWYGLIIQRLTRDKRFGIMIPTRHAKGLGLGFGGIEHGIWYGFEYMNEIRGGLKAVRRIFRQAGVDDRLQKTQTVR